MTVDINMCLYTAFLKDTEPGLLTEQIQALLDAGIVDMRVASNIIALGTDRVYLVHRFTLADWDEVGQLMTSLAVFLPKICQSPICPRTDFSCPAFRKQ